MQADTTLEVQDLSIHFDTEEGLVEAVQGVSYVVPKGRTVCIVGESGCGKSVSSYGIMRLVPSPPGKIVAGAVYLRGKDSQSYELIRAAEKELRGLRGNEIAMIFQEPMTALNPVAKIGRQVEETLQLHTAMTRKERKEYTTGLLAEVGLPLPEKLYTRYPHQLSGGQCQRVVIAIALACKPNLLLADEPTTALDVTIQAQILELLRDLQHSYGMSMVLITHDLAVVAEVADEVLVMYAGSIVESASVQELFERPRHPYTAALLDSLPSLGDNQKRLRAIAGRVPKLINLGSGCRFANRCGYRQDICNQQTPQLSGTGHRVRCHFPLA